VVGVEGWRGGGTGTCVVLRDGVLCREGTTGLYLGYATYVEKVQQAYIRGVVLQMLQRNVQLLKCSGGGGNVWYALCI
jgi:hypothetical protein